MPMTREQAIAYLKSRPELVGSLQDDVGIFGGQAERVEPGVLSGMQPTIDPVDAVASGGLKPSIGAALGSGAMQGAGTAAARAAGKAGLSSAGQTVTGIVLPLLASVLGRRAMRYMGGRPSAPLESPPVGVAEPAPVAPPKARPQLLLPAPPPVRPAAPEVGVPDLAGESSPPSELPPPAAPPKLEAPPRSASERSEARLQARRQTRLIDPTQKRLDDYETRLKDAEEKFRGGDFVYRQTVNALREAVNRERTELARLTGVEAPAPLGSIDSEAVTLMRKAQGEGVPVLNQFLTEKPTVDPAILAATQGEGGGSAGPSRALPPAPAPIEEPKPPIPEPIPESPPKQIAPPTVDESFPDSPTLGQVARRVAEAALQAGKKPGDPRFTNKERFELEWKILKGEVGLPKSFLEKLGITPAHLQDLVGDTLEETDNGWRVNPDKISSRELRAIEGETTALPKPRVDRPKPTVKGLKDRLLKQWQEVDQQVGEQRGKRWRSMKDETSDRIRREFQSARLSKGSRVTTFRGPGEVLNKSDRRVLVKLDSGEEASYPVFRVLLGDAPTSEPPTE